MNEEYDVRVSGHDEDCSYWVENDNCFCHLYERDLAYTNGYRAAVNKMKEQGDVSEGQSSVIYKSLNDYDIGLRERITQAIMNKHMFCYPPYAGGGKDFVCTHVQDADIVRMQE